AAPVVFHNGVHLPEDRSVHAVVDRPGATLAEDGGLTTRPERVHPVEERCREGEHPCERARVPIRKTGPEPDQPEQRRDQHEGEEHVEDELAVRPSGIVARGGPSPRRQRVGARWELAPRLLPFVGEWPPHLPYPPF